MLHNEKVVSTWQVKLCCLDDVHCMFHFDKNQYAEKMLECYNQWNEKYSKIDYRKHIKDNFTWEKTARNLVNFLKNNE